MKIQVCLALALVVWASARPAEDVVDFETDDMSVEQEGTPGTAVTGEYSWTAPNGQEFAVKYSAGVGGFRVLDTNAVAVAEAPSVAVEEEEDDNDDDMEEVVAVEKMAEEEEEEDEEEEDD